MPPAADSRTEAIRKMIFPPGPAVGKEVAERTAADVLPFAPEVHETIQRAWLLFQRKQREAQRADLAAKYSAMQEACEDLKQTDAQLFQAATFKVASNKRTPEEMYRLKQWGITTSGGLRKQDGEDGKPQELTPENKALLSSPEARRRLKNLGGNRLSGLFPREWRIPTSTPSRKGWPSPDGASQ